MVWNLILAVASEIINILQIMEYIDPVFLKRKAPAD
jgi:hypothetical protein